MFNRWYYDEKYHRQRVACHRYQKLRHINFFKKDLQQMFLKWMFQSNEFNPENFNTLAVTLKQNASKQERHGGNHGKLSI